MRFPLYTPLSELTCQARQQRELEENTITVFLHVASRYHVENAAVVANVPDVSPVTSIFCYVNTAWTLFDCFLEFTVA